MENYRQKALVLALNESSKFSEPLVKPIKKKSPKSLPDTMIKTVSAHYDFKKIKVVYFFFLHIFFI